MHLYWFCEITALARWSRKYSPSSKSDSKSHKLSTKLNTRGKAIQCTHILLVLLVLVILTCAINTIQGTLLCCTHLMFLSLLRRNRPRMLTAKTYKYLKTDQILTDISVSLECRIYFPILRLGTAAFQGAGQDYLLGPIPFPSPT